MTGLSLPSVSNTAQMFSSFQRSRARTSDGTDWNSRPVCTEYRMRIR